MTMLQVKMSHVRTRKSDGKKLFLFTLNCYYENMFYIKNIPRHTVCVKDYGLHNQNINVIILFLYLVGWLNFSTVGINKKIKAGSLKNCLSLCLGWRKHRHGPRKHTYNHTRNYTRMCAYKGHNPWHTVYILYRIEAVDTIKMAAHHRRCG